MATGYFLYHLDKTTCGGRIVSGASDDTHHIDGVFRQQIRVGEPLTCGKHEGLFHVCVGLEDNLLGERFTENDMDGNKIWK